MTSFKSTLALLITLFSTALAADLPEGADTQSYYICSAHSPDYLGKFTFKDFQDGASSYVNEESIGLWRHKGFWYLGDYATW